MWKRSKEQNSLELSLIVLFILSGVFSFCFSVLDFPFDSFVWVGENQIFQIQTVLAFHSLFHFSKTLQEIVLFKKIMGLVSYLHAAIYNIHKSAWYILWGTLPHKHKHTQAQNFIIQQFSLLVDCVTIACNFLKLPFIKRFPLFRRHSFVIVGNTHVRFDFCIDSMDEWMDGLVWYLSMQIAWCSFRF